MANLRINSRIYNFICISITLIITSAIITIICLIGIKQHSNTYTNELTTNEYEVLKYELDIYVPDSGNPEGVFTIRYYVDNVEYISEVRKIKGNKNEGKFIELDINFNEDIAKEILGSLYYNKDNPSKIDVYR